MCDKAVDNFLPALKFVCDWFIASKMIKKLHNTLFTDDDAFFFNEAFGSVPFSSDGMGILSVDLNNIYFDHKNFVEDDPEATYYSCQIYGLV